MHLQHLLCIATSVETTKRIYTAQVATSGTLAAEVAFEAYFSSLFPLPATKDNQITKQYNIINLNKL